MPWYAISHDCVTDLSTVSCQLSIVQKRRGTREQTKSVEQYTAYTVPSNVDLVWWLDEVMLPAVVAEDADGYTSKHLQHHAHLETL